MGGRDEGQKERERAINELAMEQAKDDLTKVVKPYIIKAKDLKKELRQKKHIKDYRKALARFMDDVLTDKELNDKRYYIAHILKISIKTLKRYLYDDSDEDKNDPNISSVF